MARILNIFHFSEEVYSSPGKTYILTPHPAYCYMGAIKLYSASKESHSAFLSITDLVPRDDAFHGNIKLLDFEWWHFEATLDQEYSVHVGLMIYHLRKSGIVRYRIDIYHRGKAIVAKTKTCVFPNLNLSRQYPYLKINDDLLIVLDQRHYQKTGEWRYQLTATIDQHTVDLSFTGTTKGWKTKTPYTSWAMVLPKAKVMGFLTLNGKKISVTGRGIHDHNWGYSPVTLLRYMGWFCGTLYFETFAFSWAKALRTIQNGELLAILNQDKTRNRQQMNYYILPPENVVFTLEKFIYDHCRRIPSVFTIDISDVKINTSIPLRAHIEMNTMDVQHVRFFTMSYWVYHVNVTGTISFGDVSESIVETPHIIEFPSFRLQSKRHSSA